MPDPRVRAHRWRCVTCTQEMSTDNPTGRLLEAWLLHHDGHEIEEEHDDGRD